MFVVTGANGFIGSAVVWGLNKANFNDIVCVDTVSPRQRPGPLSNRKFKTFLTEDKVFDFLALPSQKNKVDWIIHMGACTDTTEMNTEFLAKNNTEYTKKLFQWCTLNQTNFLYASSAAVYGSGESGFDDTTAPERLKALNPYGTSKLEFDRWVVYQKRFPKNWVGLRFFNVYGPNEYHKQEMASVVFKAFNQIRENGCLRLFRSHRPDYEDGKQMRDFVYIKDVVHWILQITKSQVTSGIFNMGSGHARSWLDLAKAVFDNMGHSLNIEWIDIPMNIQRQYQYYTQAKMKRIHGYYDLSAGGTLEDNIKDYVCNFLTKQQRYLD